jgi:transcriptional regulator with XRE-family HTH domain
VDQSSGPEPGNLIGEFMSVQLSLGDLIRHQRAALGLTQTRLAELVGRSPSTVRSWERDRTVPVDQPAIAALAAVLGLTEEEIRSAVSGPAADVEDSIQPIVEPSPDGDSTPPERPAETDATEAPPAMDADRIDMSDDRAVSSDPATGTTRGSSPSDTPSQSESPKPWSPKPVPAVAVADETVLVEAPSAVSQVSGVVSHKPRVPTYLDDPAEVRTYRTRTIVTAVLLILMVIVLSWAFTEAREALGSLFADPII